MNVEAMADVIRNDIINGWDGGSAKCGVIGEVGCSWPLTRNGSEHHNACLGL